MDDLPIFLQMFVRLFATFALGAWLHTLAPRKAEKPPEPDPAVAAKVVPHPSAEAPPKACETAPAPDGK
jgi:hypothetical protein